METREHNRARGFITLTTNHLDGETQSPLFTARYTFQEFASDDVVGTIAEAKHLKNFLCPSDLAFAAHRSR